MVLDCGSVSTRLGVCKLFLGNQNPHPSLFFPLAGKALHTPATPPAPRTSNPTLFCSGDPAPVLRTGHPLHAQVTPTPPRVGPPPAARDGDPALLRTGDLHGSEGGGEALAFLLGEPTWEDTGGGRWRCAETGHELPGREKEPVLEREREKLPVPRLPPRAQEAAAQRFYPKPSLTGPYWWLLVLCTENTVWNWESNSKIQFQNIQNRGSEDI